MVKIMVVWSNGDTHERWMEKAEAAAYKAAAKDEGFMVYELDRE